MKINIMLDPGAYLPEYAHAADAGADIRSPISCRIPPHGSAVINTGVHIEIPRGYVGMLKSKSGLNVKFDLTGEGVIDSGYSGSIQVKLYNHGNSAYFVERGDKITQLCIMPVESAEFVEVKELEATERGGAGFGSTGR